MACLAHECQRLGRLLTNHTFRHIEAYRRTCESDAKAITSGAVFSARRVHACAAGKGAC
jgi:hypothetical protein